MCPVPEGFVLGKGLRKTTLICWEAVSVPSLLEAESGTTWRLKKEIIEEGLTVCVQTSPWPGVPYSEIVP